MAPRRTRDDEDELVHDLVDRVPPDDEPIEALPLPARFAPDEADPQRYVRELFAAPLFGPGSMPADIPDLRSAGRAKLRSAGFFGDALTPFSAAPSAGIVSSGDEEHPGPPSWKLPARKRSVPATILGDDTAAGPGRTLAAPDMTPSAPPGDPLAASLPAPGLDNDSSDSPAAPSAPPRDNQTESATSSPLDHPEARTALALVAADTLLRRGAQALAQVAGGNREVVKQALDAAVAWIGSVLPPEFGASVAKTGEAAFADAHRRMDEDDSAARTRAAIGTLANHRAQAEREHGEALIGDDRAKLAEARRELLDAWRAERVARGDSPSEVNAGARALEARLTETALRHRLAQLDEAAIERALEEDEDAKADPEATRRLVDEIRRLRRDDPARAGHASLDREIERRKRDGRIDTPEEETRTRYRLRLDVQAQRGIPEHRRRLLTNDERAQLTAQYRRIEAQQGKDTAHRWLYAEAQKGGRHADKFRQELVTPPSLEAQTLPAHQHGEPSTREHEPGRFEPAQDSGRPPAEPSEHRSGDTTEQARASQRDALRRRIEADAAALSRDYDPDQRPGLPSRIKRAFALLRHVDDPAFEDLARELEYDPARLRAIGRLLTAKPGEYGAVTDALYASLRDASGRVSDTAFWLLYDGYLRDLIGTGTSPDSKAMPSEDQRVAAVLHLLDHDLSSRVRGDLAGRFDLTGDPIGQMLPPALERLSAPEAAVAAAAMWLRRRRRAGAGNAPALRPTIVPTEPSRVTLRRGGTVPHVIGREGTDRFTRQLERALSGSGYKLRFRQYERDLKEFGIRRFMELCAEVGDGVRG